MPDPRDVVLAPLVLPRALGMPLPLVALPLADGILEPAAAGVVNLVAGRVDPGGFSTKLVSVVLVSSAIVISDLSSSEVARSISTTLDERCGSEHKIDTYKKVASTSRPNPPPVTTPGP